MCFASFLSGEFITAKRTSVQWGEGPILLIGSADTFDPCFVESQTVETYVSISKVEFYRKHPIKSY